MKCCRLDATDRADSGMDEGESAASLFGPKTNVQVKRESETRAPVQPPPRIKIRERNADACAKLHGACGWVGSGDSDAEDRFEPQSCR